MNKPSSKSDTTVRTMSVILAAAIGLTACEAPKAGEKKIDDKTSTSTGSTTGSTTGNTTGNASDTPATSGTAGSADTKAGDTKAPKGPPELSDLPQLAALGSVNLAKLKDSMVLCTINGSPLTVETFKRDFRDNVLQLQATLTTQPATVNALLGTARELDVKLTDDERKKLLETARKKEALEGKTFADFLKAKKITEAQFNEQVLMLGLAFKTGTKMIEGKLLSDMINRELLLQEARKEGFYRVAMNRYIDVKHGKDYANLIKHSNQSEEQIKQSIIDQEMMLMMMQKIDKEAAVSDAVLKEQYEKSKEAFKHGDRIRVSHIVVAAPATDNPPMESVRTQIKKQKPGITPAELDAQEKIVQAQQFNKAQALLDRAKKGEDFKTLADRDSDDVPARVKKTGGDLGWLDPAAKSEGSEAGQSPQEKICAAVKDLKPGQVAPELVHTNFGWHIVKLTERQAEGYLPFDEVKDPLRQELAKMNKNKVEADWVQTKRKAATIKLSDEFIKASQAEKKD